MVSSPIAAARRKSADLQYTWKSKKAEKSTEPKKQVVASKSKRVYSYQPAKGGTAADPGREAVQGTAFSPDSAFLSDQADWDTSEKPADKIFFPDTPLKDNVVPANSNLTDSASETSAAQRPVSPKPAPKVNVYHLERRLNESAPYLSSKFIPTSPGGSEDVRRPSPRHREKLNRWYQQKSQKNISRRRSEDSDTRILSSGSESYDNTYAETYADTYADYTYADTYTDRTYDIDTYGSRTYDDRTYETSYRAETFDETVGDRTYDDTIDEYEDRRRRRRSRSQRRRLRGKGKYSMDERDYVLKQEMMHNEQEIPFFCILIIALQLLVLCTQMALCGIASLEVNPMVGPFPDAFSEWGGKNAYLMLMNDQWWRLLTSSFLHVGIIHLLVNAFCMFMTISVFELEWGSFRWVFLYVISAAGSTAISTVADPDTISVGSSGALMGLYAAKLAQVVSHTCFDVDRESMDRVIRMEQLSSVLVGLTLVSLLSSITYVEFSGHLGGLVVGFFGGIIAFSGPIVSWCSRCMWSFSGLLCLGAVMSLTVYVLLEYVEPDEEIADACEYFRNLYPEDYDCDCKWQE